MGSDEKVTAAAKFVGGTADGRVYAFPSPPPNHFKVAVAPKPVPYWWDNSEMDSPLGLTYTTEVYRLVTLWGATKDFYLYAPESWDMDDVLGHLLYGKDHIVSERPDL